MRHMDLRGRLIYLAGPRTWADREVWAPVEATLLELGLIDAPAEESFRRVAKALRSAGSSVFSPFEQAYQLGPDGDPADSRAGRAADTAALHGADLVVVLDGWGDVPGAVDTAILVAATRGTSWAAARTVFRAVGAEAFAA